MEDCFSSEKNARVAETLSGGRGASNRKPYFVRFFNDWEVGEGGGSFLECIHPLTYREGQ